MKPFVLTIFTILLLINCKKDSDNANCKLEQKTSYSNGTVSSSFKYEYDDMNRIKKIAPTYGGSGMATNFTYYPDSIVALSNFQRQTYFLGTNGLADTSSLIVLGSAEQLKFYYTYTYNAEGYLVNEREIFSQLHNGNTILDTIVNTYTITNGNLVKINSTQTPDDLTFEYSAELRPANNIELMAETGRFPFLGKQSKNLVSKMYVNGMPSYDASYEKDKKGNIIKQTQRNSTSGQSSMVEYTYTCN